jgi:Zn-dependent protease
MKSWSISVGRILGVELRLHFTFLLLIVFISFFAMDTPGGAGVLRGLGLMAVVLLAVVGHEAGHIVAAQVRRIPLRAVVLLPIGGLPFRDGTEAHRAPVPQDEVFFALAGPIASLLAGAISAVAVILVEPESSMLARPQMWADHN